MAMATWSIRKADNRDADALSACITAAYAEVAARIADLPPVAENCAEEIAAHQVWVAEARNAVVGGLVLVPSPGFMLLANVAVHPDHQGSGLGRALMALAETEASAQGYAELRLNTHKDMPENITMYRHLGWQQSGRDGNKVSMTKRL